MPLITVHIGGQSSVTLFPLHRLALINSHCLLKEGEDPSAQGENMTASPPSFVPPLPAQSVLLIGFQKASLKALCMKKIESFPF